tara:strand:- start:162 stop:329 length:168 start_codon:yes stop_codon:yes gene_type:complete
MRKYLKDNWMIYPVPIFAGLLIGFTDFSVGKKIIYLIIFSISLPIIIYLYKKIKK